MEGAEPTVDREYEDVAEVWSVQQTQTKKHRGFLRDTTFMEKEVRERVKTTLYTS